MLIILYLYIAVWIIQDDDMCINLRDMDRKKIRRVGEATQTFFLVLMHMYRMALPCVIFLETLTILINVTTNMLPRPNAGNAVTVRRRHLG